MQQVQIENKCGKLNQIVEQEQVEVQRNWKFKGKKWNKREKSRTHR